MDRLVPFEFDADVIFIAADVEAYEHAHDIITEIGISILDTRDLGDHPPGEDGKNWHQFIRSRHFRIKEFMHLNNKTYVHGCADRFDFGTSEIIPKDSAAKIVADCFKPDSNTSGSNQNEKLRNIVFLGHDTQQDVQYLRKIGYDVTNLSNLLETQDTSIMFRAFSEEPNPRNLGYVVSLFGIEPWNMHNAGNDAAFTVQAMLGLCVHEAANNRGERAKQNGLERERRLQERIEAAKKETEERLREDAAGWELDEDDDGGVPYANMANMRLTAGGRILDI